MNSNYVEYYYEDSDNPNYYIVLSIDLIEKKVYKTSFVTQENLKGIDSITYLNKKIGSVLFNGFISNYYYVEESPLNNINNIDRRRLEKKFYFSQKLNERVNDKKIADAIEKEKLLFDEYTKKADNYYSLDTKRNNLIIKAFSILSDEDRKSFNIGNEDMPEFEVLNTCYTKRNDKEYRAKISELNKKLLKDNIYYKESVDLLPSLNQAELDFLKSSENLNNYFEKERELFSKEYKKKMDEYYDDGVMLYWQKTPDLPIDDENITYEDVLEYYFQDNCMYLEGILQIYTNKSNVGESFVRKADDLIATIELLQRGHYRAALRNLFSLLDGEHKKCYDVMNGYYKKREESRRGLVRAKRIKELVESMKSEYYSFVWTKVDEMYGRINRNEILDYLPNRNIIVHGDYKKDNLDVSGYDVIKVLFLYLSMRDLADYMCNLEETIKIINSNLVAYLSNNDIEK